MAPAAGYRPSSGTHSTEETQVAATNSAVHKFLGSRQPSWMTNARPVKPTPRPPDRVPKAPLPEMRAPRLTSSHQRRQNSVTTRTASAATVAAPGSPIHAEQPTHLDLLADPIPTSALTATSSATPPSIAPSNELSPAVPPVQGTLSPRRHIPSAPDSASLPVTQAQFVLQETVEAGSRGIARPVQPSSRRAESNGLGQSSEIGGGSSPGTVSSFPSLSPPPAPNARPRRAPSLQLPDENQEAPPAKRRRTGNMSLSLLQSLNAVALLDHQIHKSGGESALDINVERPRYQLLKEACLAGDLFFVVLHQMFCAWSVQNSIAHNLCIENLHDTNLIDNAFGLMGTILKSNSKIRGTHVQFFQNFPGTLETMRARYPLYSDMIIQILNFLVRLSQLWMVVNHDHKKRGYPLLMDELLGIFGLHSPILQRIVFRASRRSLGVPDGSYGQQMDEMFSHEQQTHQDADGHYIATVTQNFEVEPGNWSLIVGYRNLIARMRVANTPQTTVPPPQPPYAVRPQHQQTHCTQPPAQQYMSSNSGYSVGGENLVMASHVHGQQNRANPFISGNPTPGGLVFPPHQYQFPSTHLPVLQNNVNSPTNVQFSSITSPSAQPSSPSHTQSIQAQAHVTANGGQFARNSPTHPSFHSYQLHQRRASQQLVAVGSTRSPQMQQLAAMAPPDRTSPVQNTTNSPSQVQATSHISPIPSNLQMPIQPRIRRGPTPSTLFAAHSAGNMIPAPFSPVINMNAAYGNIQQHEQQQQHNRPGSTNPQTVDQIAHAQQTSARSNSIVSRPSPQITPNRTSLFNPLSQLPRIEPSQYPHDPYDRKSLEMSLHQWHTRSPRRMVKDFLIMPERYYQSIKYLALQPTQIPPKPGLQRFCFDVSALDHQMISPNKSINKNSLPVNLFWDGSLRLRLRVCLVKGSAKSISEMDWVLSDTNWPDHIYFQLNSVMLSVRRKQHHSKDLPIEIGAFIREGKNELVVSVPPSVPLTKNMVPYIAVEVIETLSHSTIVRLPNLDIASIIPADDTRAVIQRRLGGAKDDEITMTISDLRINLADPFSYSIWQVPVRGKDCSHLECFDLDTWLQTRPSKKSCVCGAKKASDCTICPKEPSLVDKWKCPLCQGDARPYRLVVDGYLVEVRQALADKNLLSVKEIEVSADGSWNPIIPEPDSDSDSDNGSTSTGRGVRPSAKTTLQNALGLRAPVEVISVSDDDDH